MQLVVELVGLRAQRLGDALARRQLALHRHQLGAVAQGRHRAYLAAAVDHPVAVEHHHPLPEHQHPVLHLVVADQRRPQAGVEIEVLDLAAQRRLR